MNLYDIEICRAIDNLAVYDHKTMYYIVTNDSEVYILDQLPEHIECISLQQWSDMLYEAFKQELDEFIQSPYNQDVYSLAIATNEYRLYQLFANNVEDYEKSREEYSKTEEDDYKYSFDNFEFCTQLGDDEVNDFQQAIVMISYDFSDDDIELPLYTGDFTDVQHIVDSRLVHFSDYVIVQDVAKRLKAYVDEHVHQSADFMFYASADNLYIDDSLAIRKMISTELLYRVQPVVEQGDKQFEHEKEFMSQLPILEQLRYWTGEEASSVLEICNKTPYQIMESVIEQIHIHAVDPLQLWKEMLQDWEADSDQTEPLLLMTYVLYELNENGTFTEEIKLLLEDKKWDAEEYNWTIQNIRHMLSIKKYPLYTS